MIEILKHTDEIDFAKLLKRCDVTETATIFGIKNLNYNFVKAAYYPGVGDREILTRQPVLGEIQNVMQRAKGILLGIQLLSIINLEGLPFSCVKYALLLPYAHSSILTKSLEPLLAGTQEESHLLVSQNILMLLLLCAEYCDKIRNCMELPSPSYRSRNFEFEMHEIEGRLG